MVELELEFEEFPTEEDITKLFFVFDNIIEGESLEGQEALELFQRIQLESLQ